MIDEWYERNPITTVIVVLLLVCIAGFIMYWFARLLIGSLNESARYEQPLTTLMLILGTISVTALIGALFSGNESAYTIAATGVGAFAGALTARSQAASVHQAEQDSQARMDPPEIWPQEDGEDHR